MRTSILEKLKEIVSEVKGLPLEDFNNVKESTTIREDLCLNSVGILYVVFAIEQEFGCRFEELNFEDFKTIGDVIDYIEKNN